MKLLLNTSFLIVSRLTQSFIFLRKNIFISLIVYLCSPYIFATTLLITHSSICFGKLVILINIRPQIYFCLTNIRESIYETKYIIYPNFPSAMRPVLHFKYYPLRKYQDFVALIYNSNNDLNHLEEERKETNDIAFKATFLQEYHFLTQESLVNLFGILNFRNYNSNYLK